MLKRKLRYIYTSIKIVIERMYGPGKRRNKICKNNAYVNNCSKS